MKRLLALICAGIMVVSIVGCSGGETTESSGTNIEQNTEIDAQTSENE